MAQQKKPTGRKKGCVNRTTAFSKAIINNILSDYQSSGLLMQDLELLDPKDRLHVMIKLMEFITPKPQSVDMTINAEAKITTEDTLRQLALENDLN